MSKDEAIAHYESALKEAFPKGATGDVFHYWNEARKALAAQPAQQEPVIGETNVELGFYSNDARNEQFRELAGKVAMGQLVGNRPHESASNPDAKREIAVIAGVDEYGPMLNWYTHWVNFPVGTKLYTSPPAQRTWVGLKADELRVILGGDHTQISLALAIEAKLKEKNT